MTSLSPTLLAAVLLIQTLSARPLHAQSGVISTTPSAPGKIGSTVTGAIGTEKAVVPDKVVVRGWQIQAVSAIRQGVLSDVFPEYDQKRPIGNRTNALAPAKGSFLVILVQCQSATGQSLNQPLWAGKPDVVLVDEVGLEYPALGKLTQQGGQLLTQGMVTGPNRRNRRLPVGNHTSALVYFDVPSTTRAFSLRFGEAGPSIPVTQVQNLPGLATE